jgi:hypothetical protein
LLCRGVGSECRPRRQRRAEGAPHAATRPRKLRSSCLPCGVSTDSGWN